MVRNCPPPIGRPTARLTGPSAWPSLDWHFSPERVAFMPEHNDSAERRWVPRCPCRASFCRLLGGVDREAQVRDLSTSGVGLLCNGPVQPGQLLSLRLSGPSTAIALAMQARVAHAHERADGRWLVGCAFDRRLPDAFVALLL
jgi:PilZ domain